MRTASTTLIDYLNSLRGQSDAMPLMADCFTFALADGTVLIYTSFDQPIPYNGSVYAANAVRVDGLKYKCRIGLDVDQQKCTVIALSTETVDGVPFLQALANGVFDGCEIARDRVFLNAGPPLSVIGGVTLFKGRLGEVTSIGRTSAELTVNSDLVLLDLQMPRNLYAPGCIHVLYDSGCGLNRNNFSATGTVEAGSTNSVIRWSGASAAYIQGTLSFTTGFFAGKSVTIKGAIVNTDLQLAYPLLQAPAPGDAFTVYQGCDHTQATCQAKFNNLGNFRGYPYIPPPVFAA